MTLFSKLSTAMRQPRQIPSYITHRGLYDIYTFYQRKLRAKDGIKIMEEDWDNLIILDACRYDSYLEKKNLPGKCRAVISKGSTTTEFIQKNFTKNEHYDTVYITANPHVDRYVTGKLHSVISPWKTHWNETFHTVMPETMADITAKNANMYPEKRLISHFIQPHRPFIGERGKKIEDYKSVDGHREMALGKDPDWEGENPYNQLKHGEISETVVREAYEENLELVLSAITDLVSKLEGRTVVTADHGNLFSDRFPSLPEAGFPHPGGMYLSDLVKVPWHVIPSERRRTITAAPPKNNNDGSMQDGDVQEKLKHLGYLE
ncbi:hypothetical protein [Halorubrum ezzemoulense]|uniref:PglZ domain-containing protein n=1 Tax=Halorubrum ezzemoulense TaxID=337243 RepID=A0A481RC92_HALEZ|nr:hypothetical protein [Halorubrum ezzemoulense]QAY18880.1 hypothetical protein EO776_01995 [Halorubrum ezzemoulense]